MEMKTVLYYILGAVFALSNEGCQVSIGGNGSRVAVVKIGFDGQGRRVQCAQPAVAVASGQCGGGEIITICDHRTGRVVWRGIEAEMPLALRAGWLQHRQLVGTSFGAGCDRGDQSLAGGMVQRSRASEKFDPRYQYGLDGRLIRSRSKDQEDQSLAGGMVQRSLASEKFDPRYNYGPDGRLVRY